MKKLLLVLALVAIPFIAINAKSKQQKAQEIAEAKTYAESIKPYYKLVDDDVEFARVIQAPNYPTKDALYLRCLEILNIAYKNSKEVIQTQDKEGGLIIGKGCFIDDIYATFLGTSKVGYREAKHTIKIEVKDGRFKVTITVNSNLSHIYATTYTRAQDITHKVVEYYPIWLGGVCPEDKIATSLGNVRYIFDDAINILDLFESEVNKPISNDSDW